MNRRSFLKNTLGGIVSVAGISGGVYYYAREIEPFMLQLKQEIISSRRIPTSFNNFKVIQFTDTHVGFHYTLSELKKLVKKINNLKPDLVVFTGDLLDEPQAYRSNDELAAVLRLINAQFGKFWVYGNHDHGGFGTDIVRSIMDNAGFQLLKNDHAVINYNNEKIIIAGIDDAILGIPDLDRTLKHANTDLFTILLAHEPDFADVAIHFPIDIQLSGHSHGGQVRFPFIGHLYTPIYAENYIQGKYILNEDLTLYVNRGIGTTRLPFRFLCKPEIHEFTFKSMN